MDSIGWMIASAPGETAIEECVVFKAEALVSFMFTRSLSKDSTR